MSNVEQWEPDELRAMDNEIISLREQVEKWKSLHESLTKLNEAQERRHEKQVEKLTKERDEYKSGFEAAASKYRNLKLQMQEIINVC